MMSEYIEPLEIPSSIPKLEAELLRDAYESSRHHTDPGVTEDAEHAEAETISQNADQVFYRRALDIGISEDTLSELGFENESATN